MGNMHNTELVLAADKKQLGAVLSKGEFVIQTVYTILLIALIILLLALGIDLYNFYLKKENRKEKK